MKVSQRKLFTALTSVLLICITALMCSCFLFKHIEDTNGEDDYSLCTITEARICSGSTSIVEFGAVTNNSSNRIEYSVKKMSGVKVLSKISVNSADTYVGTITTNITSGNLRVCFINNGNIIRDVELNKTERIELSNLSGTLELRVAGESAAFTITIS